MLANDRSTASEDVATRRSSAARSWTWSRPDGRSPSRQGGRDQRSVDLHLASSRPIDKGLTPGLSSPEREELAAARRRIAQLETELAVTAGPPSCSRSRRPRSMVRGHPGDGYPRLPSAALLPGAGGLGVRLLRLAEPTTVAADDPPRLADRGDQAGPCRLRADYGSRRVQAERTLGRGITVGFHAVELPVAPGRPAGRHRSPQFRRGLRPEATAGDLVNRQFGRSGPNQLWVTDITEHPTGEGKLSCAVVLDACSRRVVGWSIDATRPRPWSPTRWGWRSSPASRPRGR
jgi:putative transposase